MYLLSIHVKTIKEFLFDKTKALKTKFPNTSILSLLTQTNDRGEKLLFIYLKPVSDFYPFGKIHWYEGKGKDGKAIDIWTKLSIKQWVTCGKDSDIALLFDNILASKKLMINKTEISILVPIFKLNPHSSNPSKNRGETIFDSLSIEDRNQIPQEFFQRENLKILSGFLTAYDEIKPIFPIGFFEEDFIYDNLKKDVFGVKEYRTPYLTFHGVRKTSEKGIGSKEMVGFYQQNFDNSSTYSAIVKNNNNQEIGKTTIDKKTGFFKIGLSEPTQKGKVEILINDNEEKAIEYVLIQDIKFDVNIATTTFTDAYGRDYLIPSKKKSRPENISNFTWQRNIYSNPDEADKVLSDRFKNIFDYLGPKILIADPYFLGNFNQDEITKQISPSSHCQLAFINAMVHSAIEKGINEINILGCFQIAKNYIDNPFEMVYDASIDTTEIEAHFKKSSVIFKSIQASINTKNDKIHISVKIQNASGISKSEQFFEKYEKYFSGFIPANKLESYFPKQTIFFKNAKERFHNRYWFSIAEKDGSPYLNKCVIITNSIGNINEVDIMLVSDDSPQLKQITRKYSWLFDKSETMKSI